MNSMTISQLIGSEDEFYRKFKDYIFKSLWVCLPGIIQNFNPNEETVTVKPVLREEIINRDQTKSIVDLPLLLDVPIVIPQSDDVALTLPIRQGTECLIVFGDMCIDAWFSYGGIQNQIEKRRHDLSDGFAIVGIKSQPNIIPNYSTDAAELRTISGNTKISLKEGEININATTIKMNGVNVTPTT